MEKREREPWVHKEKLTYRDKSVIRKKLGIPSWACFPKCPAKSRRFVLLCEAAGDYTHSDRHHYCIKCACKRTAGFGTDHFGWGWCFVHEKGRRKAASKEFAMNHLEAIQQRHPSLYHNADKYFDAVESEGLKSAQAKSVEAEIKLLRATTLEMIERIKNGECVGGHDKDGGAIKLSDKDRVAMIKNLTEAIGKLVKIDFDINSGNVISVDAYKVWMAGFARAVKEQFPSKEDQLKFVEASKKAGEPKRG
jgi:hypothetical protein